MKTRTDLLNHLAEKYNLQRYLEIGVQNTSQNFDKIKCAYKVCVDPDPAAGATYCKTSDEYFTIELSINADFSEEYHKKFDLVFIDGLHTAEQVALDCLHAMDVLSPNGFIVCHDCNPTEESHTIVPRPTKTGHWNGDVYRFAMQLTIDKHTVDIDNGCMVVPYSKEFGMQNHRLWDWNYFNKNRKELLNLISWEEFIKL
jgi:hypothetical protein